MLKNVQGFFFIETFSGSLKSGIHPTSVSCTYKALVLTIYLFSFSRTIAHLRIIFCDVDKCNKSKNDPSHCYLQRHFLAGIQTLAPEFFRIGIGHI